MKNGRLIRRALKETILYLEAPNDSPRHWPVSRANLYKLVKNAYAEAAVKPIRPKEEE